MPIIIIIIIIKERVYDKRGSRPSLVNKIQQTKIIFLLYFTYLCMHFYILDNDSTIQIYTSYRLNHISIIYLYINI